MMSITSSASSSLKKNDGVSAHTNSHTPSRQRYMRNCGEAPVPSLLAPNGRKMPGKSIRIDVFIALTACRPDTVSARAVPARGAFDERGTDRTHAERALLVGDDRHDRRHRVVAGRAGLLGGQPRPRPQQQLVVGQVGGLAARRVWREPRVHEGRVVLPQLLGREPRGFQLTRREVHDHDVGRRRQLHDHDVAGRHDPLGPVGVAPERGTVGGLGRRLLDPHDVRAVLTQVHGRDRPAGRDRQVEHRHSVERAPHGAAAISRRSGAVDQELPIWCSSMFAIFWRASSRLAGSHSEGHRPSTAL